MTQIKEVRYVSRVKKLKSRARGRRTARSGVSISKLTKEADRVCSLFVRQSSADKDGFVVCYTCGHKAHYKKMHAGHYLSRFYKSTRWLLTNVKPQCPMCNLWKRGDAPTFRENLIRDHGIEVVEAMEASRKTITKLDPQLVQTQILYFKERLSQLNP